MTPDISRYNIYSEYLKKKYGGKVYKLPVNLPGTCPNRDGTLGYGGCIFCDEAGAGFQCLPNTMEIKKQIEENREYFKKRFNAQKFIVYFQAFTNTYLPLSAFMENIKNACLDDVVGISVSTRPDCINDKYLDFLLELKEKSGLNIDIELGLQTVNYHTLEKINRGHSLAEFIDAVLRIHQRGFCICAHLILNLPWDGPVDVVENAKIISALGIRYVKLHSLYVVAGTRLGELYKRGEAPIPSMDQYVDSVVLFLEHLDPQIVIQRLVGKGPEENVLFSNWGSSWWKIKHTIESELAERDTRQGNRFNYLNGRALTVRGMPEL
ncbi:MAG: TIGR01212 family radical SAM protein [Firmicutes bacterium]|nr:TIGR01212 family radical SAM protein [Bacillota bacterium]MCL5057715.1 TIGR01212 family radical SAM protein [Actinomycetota bacterium]